MKAIDLMVKSLLPPDLYDPARRYNKKGIDALLAEVARRYPDRYADIAEGLADLGRNTAYFQGETLTLADMKAPFNKQEEFAKMDAELGAVEHSDLKDDEKRQQRLKIWERYAGQLEKQTVDASIRAGSNLANTVVSGARGNPFQLKAMVTTPALYTDYRDRPVELFVRNSFGEGLRPAEYLASTFGVRKSVISTKNLTAEGGDMLKQLMQVSTPLIVTAKDCDTTNGLDFAADDDALRGRILGQPAAGIPAGTPIDREVMNKLRQAKVKTVIARSPMTCQAKEGICSKCLGLLPEGKLAPLGYAAGITAAQATGEPVTQGALNCLVEGTLVRMADFSVRPIESVRVGDWVLGSDKQGQTFPVEVIGKWDQGLQSAHEFSYRMGNTRRLLTLQATVEHPLLSNKKVYGNHKSPNNRRVVMLKAGYPHKNLGVVLPVDNKHAGVDEPLAMLVGVWLGDGIRNGPDNPELRMSCADATQMQRLGEIYAALNLKFTKRKRSFDWGITQLKDSVRQDEKTGRLVAGLRNPIKLRLEQMRLLRCYAHEKFIPREVWNWNQSSITSLVAGYLATDGSVYRNKEGHVGLSFGSVSKQLLEDLRELLAVRLCVYGSEISCTGEAGSGNRVHAMWQFYITRHDQVERLASLIPEIPGVKDARLRQYLREVTYAKQHTEGFYRALRVGIVPIGPQQCWDLTVDHPDHLFVLASGIICSNTKHSGGGFSGGKKQFAGLPIITQFIQSPEVFPHRAATAHLDGRVEAIDEAPQGGTFITVAGQQHFALPGYEPTVKVGDEVEAGDSLSEGIVDPADVVNFRGLGEARRYYADRLGQILSDSGAGNPSKLNMETLARATLDHVRVNDPDGLGDYLVDDLASYNRVAPDYSPPADTKPLSLEKAKGMYLQSPALHYTIGTRLTPRMLKHLGTVGFQQVNASPTAPTFTPEMVRLRGANFSNPDWLAKLDTSYLSTNLAGDAARARDTDVGENVHFAPRLAVGVGFGQKVEQTGKF